MLEDVGELMLENSIWDDQGALQLVAVVALALTVMALHGWISANA